MRGKVLTLVQLLCHDGRAPCGGWEGLSEWLVNVALGKAAHSRAVCLSEGKEGALSQHSSLATPVETDFLLCFTNLLLGGC